MASPAHPYYPRELELAGLQLLVVDFPYVLGTFAVFVTVVLSSVWLYSGRRAHLSTLERLLACWFALTGLIHLVVEGYVVLKSDFIHDQSGMLKTYLSDVWKEYSKADSRYITRDAFIVSMEAVTAFAWGPASMAVVCGVLRRAPWRYGLMLIVSVGQIYGDVLYFATCFFEGLKHTRPELMYFWGYFLGANGIWIVVPGLVALHALRQMSRAVAGADAGEREQTQRDEKTEGEKQKARDGNGVYSLRAKATATADGKDKAL